MDWLNRILKRGKIPEKGDDTEKEEVVLSVETDSSSVSEVTSLMRRAEWAQPLLQELKEEAELFRRSLAYKDHWPETHAEGRWFEVGMLRLNEEQKAEWEANYHWMIGEDLRVYQMWFENFVRDFDYCGRKKLTDDYAFDPPTVKEVEEREKETELYERMQESFDLTVQKTRKFIERQMERAETEPNLGKPGAYEALARLKTVWEKLDKVMDLNQPPPVQYEKSELKGERLEEIKGEFFRLHEVTESSYAKLRQIGKAISEATELLDYQLDEAETARRDSFDSPFGEIVEYEKEQLEKKKNLPQKTEHDIARQWGFHVSHIQNANHYYEKILEDSWWLGFDYSELLERKWNNLRTNTNMAEDASIEEIKKRHFGHRNQEEAFKKHLTRRHVELMERTLGMNQSFAVEQLDNFFTAIAAEDRVWNPGVLEKLTEIKKLVEEFKQIGGPQKEASLDLK